MREYQSKYEYKINGKTCYAVTNDERFKKDSDHLIGERVLIDGNQYVVKAVEAHCLESIREGAEIGLMVELVS